MYDNLKRAAPLWAFLLEDPRVLTTAQLEKLLADQELIHGTLTAVSVRFPEVFEAVLRAREAAIELPSKQDTAPEGEGNHPPRAADDVDDHGGMLRRSG